MTVLFDDVEFNNTTGIDMHVTLESPIGVAVGRPTVVLPNSTDRIRVGLTNRPSVRISADDGAHGVYSQSFAVAPAVAGKPSFLVSVSVAYSIGSFTGHLTAATEGDG